MAAKAKRIRFDLDRQLPLAWDWCWENRWNGRPWVSATDVMSRLKSAATEIQDGVEYGTYQNHGRGFNDARIRINETQWGHRMTLLAVVRRWLRTQVSRGRLEYSSGSHGTVSGARYRPRGAEYTEAEKKARETPKEERDRKAHIVHALDILNSETKHKVGMCGAGNNPRARWTPRRKHLHFTTNPLKITCKRCMSHKESQIVSEAHEIRSVTWLSDFGSIYDISHDDVKLGVIADKFEEAGKDLAAEGLRRVAKNLIEERTKSNEE